MIPGFEDKGIVEVVEYKENEFGEKIKVIKKIRKYVIYSRTNENIKERKENWTKFGLAAISNEGVTTLSSEEVFMEPPPSKEEKSEEIRNEIIKDEIKNEPEERRCTICNGKHWSRICKMLKEKDKEKFNENNEIKEKPKINFDTSTTIKILSLNKNIGEHDLYEMFSYNNTIISKISIPKDMSTSDTKGIAFITFKNKEDAEIAIKKFNNRGIDNVIIHVSFLKDN